MSVVRIRPRNAMGSIARDGLLHSASIAALALALSAAPSHAQLARLRAGAAAIPDASGARPTVGTVPRSASMRQALANQQTSQQRVTQLRQYVTSVRQAAAAAAVRSTPTDGISVGGLNPIQSIRQAMQLSQAGGAQNQAQVTQILAAARAANDPTGTATWDGAGLPEQTVANGLTTVSITQTQARALLSWDRFDIGANTTLNFNQTLGGKAQTGWIAVNRVVDATDPTTILGKITGDGGVYILNSKGVIFGKGSQVNLHSLVSSSLELGNYASTAARTAATVGGVNQVTLSGLSLQARNVTYLQNGVFPTSNAPTYSDANGAPPLFLSPLLSTDAITQNNGGSIAFGTAEGDVIVDPGASITTGAGGMLLLAAPRVENYGTLSATDGQVSLVGGRLITFAQSDGSASSADPNVRGIVFRALDRDNRAPTSGQGALADDGIVINRGLIESKRGYISLVATATGDVVNGGLLSATTSVSRNGKVGLYAGRVTIEGADSTDQAGGIVITADENGETIPQGSADEPANFKRSQVEIGAFAFADRAEGTQLVDDLTNPLGRIINSTFTMGENALIYAPNAVVSVGKSGRSQEDIRDTTAAQDRYSIIPNGIAIDTNALIDVSGLKEVGVDVSRNFITITPVKRNELRDTPTYREVAIGDEFTLNGETLTVDIRRTGVREDGVKWVGSPLIEAGSLASQISVTASEQMTKGGDVSFATGQNVSLAKGAAVDISGGWVTYTGVETPTSRLVTADGRVVDIANADPNDNFVSVYSGFIATQPRFGISRQYNNPTTAGASTGSAYDEGRDAGSFAVEAAATRIDGVLRGAAYAGQRQLAAATAPTATSTLSGDFRKLQANAFELPSGGYVKLPSFGDIILYRGTLNSDQSDFAQTLLNDAMLSDAGLSALSLDAFGQIILADADQALLQPDGAFTLTGKSKLTLADGGTLGLKAGRSILFDGDVSIAGGAIKATTVSDLRGLSNNRTADDVVGLGSIFRTDDDVRAAYAADATPPALFDIIVNGTLSTAGRWTNDIGAQNLILGGSWIDGGTIDLTVAPNVFVAEGQSVGTAQRATDLSGSILINGGALLNVNAGGYVNAQQQFDLTGTGGSVSLINETRYAGTSRTIRPLSSGEEGKSDLVFGGDNQTVGFTPRLAGDPPGASDLVPALVASVQRARVSIDGAISAFGFAGSGAFTLTSPDIAFGSDTPGENATRVGLDFAANTGFGALNLTSNRSRIVSNLFDNGRDNLSAFAETTSFTIRDGETLDLTQTMLPIVSSREDVAALRGLQTGGNILDVLTPAIAAFAFDRKAVDFTIGGYGELVIEQGGRLVGAAKAVITAPKIINSGTISLPSGILRQEATAPNAGVQNALLGVRSLTEVLGQETGNDENALNRIVTGADGALLTNGDLFTANGQDRILVFLGVGDQNSGILLNSGSVTDLSGTVIYDPRAPFTRTQTGSNLVQARTGRILGGGSILAASTLNDEGENISGLSRTIDMMDGAIVDISGTQGIFDVYSLRNGYVATPQWSDAGTISMLGGGTIAGARINAFGGYADDGGTFIATGIIDPTRVERRARGGTLEALRPTLVQTISAAAAATNGLSADQVMTAGFDSLIARDGVRFGADVALTLRQSFIASANVTRTGKLQVGDTYLVTAGDGIAANVTAQYVAFLSNNSDKLIATTLEASDPAPTTDTAATVSFQAGAQGIQFTGGTAFGASIGTLGFRTAGDIRFTGIDGRTAASRLNDPTGTRLNGELLSFADTTFDGGRIFATTGSGNLQLFLNAESTGKTVNSANTRPFQIAALGDHDITFASSTPNGETPLSAGSYVSVVAANITQNGRLYAPLGRLELGSASYADPAVLRATQSVTFGAGSVTSVSGGDQKIPYGTTLDLKEYYFTPLSLGVLTTIPNSELRIAGGAIDIQQGATVDLSGGGDIFAYEFVSGVGGSRDVLDRFNSDTFSSNDFDPATGLGYQYADHRQVYAIVPKNTLGASAAYDPIYSADYGSNGPADLYGSQIGRTVILDGSNGIAAGEYVLMPAHYALLEGAYRIVENTDVAAPDIGTTQTLRDGSIIIGGSYAYAETGIVESVRRSFTLQSAATFKSYSRIETSSGSTAISDQAKDAGVTAPRLPLDAARLVLNPLVSLKAMGLFDTQAAAGSKGLQVDISAQNIIVAAAGGAETAGFVTIEDSTLAQINPESLFLGGRRIENGNGTTDLRIDASQIIVQSGAALTAPEILLAVGNGKTGNSRLSIEDGASVIATGAIAQPNGADYVIPAFATAPQGFVGDSSGAGSVVRVAVGVDRGISRTGPAAANALNAGTALTIGAAVLQGNSLAVTTTRNIDFDPGVTLAAPSITLASGNLTFNDAILAPAIQAQLFAAETLTLQSAKSIGFDPGAYKFNNLNIDSPGVTLANIQDGRKDTIALTITADKLHFENSGATLGACKAGQCGTADDTLTFNASEISFGSGTVRTIGFGGPVTLSASNGIYVEGIGAFDTGTAQLRLNTPFIADRGAVADPRQQTVRPDYSFGARDGIVVSASGFAVPAPGAIAGNRAPGARISFGDSDTTVRPATNGSRSITITDSLVLATAGAIKLDADGDIALNGTATLATPGWTKTFGDTLDSVTVAASGGVIDVLARNGNIGFGSNAVLISDNGIGNAGAIALRAPDGSVVFNGSVNPGVATARANDFTLDSAQGAFDFANFMTRFGVGFGGELTIRTGTGDLALETGQTVRAQSVSLTADGGIVRIAGTIDTSGVDVSGLSLADAKDARVNGGAIALYGQNGVTLAATAVLDTHTLGYAALDARSASAGDVMIGIGNTADGAIQITSGARIDAGARRSQAAAAAGLPAARLIAESAKEVGTLAETTVYRYVEADSGGTITLRAPVIGINADKINVSLASANSFVGAQNVQIEGYRSYDLDAIATRSDITGVIGNGNGVTLNPGADAANGYRSNLLSGDFITDDGLASISHFIRTFSVTASDGSDLTGLRLRPGVDLESSGSITLAGAWNLAAADIDQNAAFAAGLLEINSALGLRTESYGLNQAETPYYNVVAGREGELLERFGNFYYRVGGKAAGEAPILRFRGGGEVTIGASISDGFFVFHDRSDQSYINYQLGGGDRTYNAALRLTCGTIADGNCTDLAQFGDDVPLNGRNAVSAKISLNNATYGTQTSPLGTHAPFSAETNSPAALGNVFDKNTGERIAGAGLTYGELFPLLSDGSAMHASDIVFIAGGADDASANPYYVSRSKTADVTVVDSLATRANGLDPITYELTSKAQVASIGSAIDFVSGNAGVDDPTPTSLDALLGGTTPDFAGLDSNTYTILTWGTLSEEGKAYFSDLGRTFTGTKNNPTGVIAPLAEVVAFLKLYAPTILQHVEEGTIKVSGTPDKSVRKLGGQVYVETFVRTGDGNISINAARDVDLRGSDAIVYRRANGLQANVNSSDRDGFAAQQVGGAAIYTAGKRVQSSALLAQRSDGTVSSVPLDAALFVARAESVNSVPTSSARTDHDPVLANGGGDVAVMAGRDVLGRMDYWSGQSAQASYTGTGSENLGDRTLGVLQGTLGLTSQSWRAGGLTTTGGSIGILPEYFQSGLGALAGGDIRVQAGRDVSDLTAALDTSIVKSVGDDTVLATFGSGNFSLTTGRDLIAGQFDVTSGQGFVETGRNVQTLTRPQSRDDSAAAQVDRTTFRLENATINLTSGGDIGGIDTYGLGAGRSIGSNQDDTVTARGYANATLYSPVTSLAATALGDVSFGGGDFVAPTLELAALQGAVTIAQETTLYPSPIGQLTLLSAKDIGDFSIAMLDIDPSYLRQSAFSAGTNFEPGLSRIAGTQGTALFQRPADFPGVNSLIDETTRRLMHNSRITHLNDFDPVRIYTDGSITNTSINLPKFANIHAGVDIIDTFFVGQNVRSSDETRISAGRDIGATTQTANSLRGLPYFNASSYYLGGGGVLTLEAGRNLGPFATSAIFTTLPSNNLPATTLTYGGGVLTVGNEYNPWLSDEGADLNISFGVGPGQDLDALRETYLNPVNFAQLDGDLFEQVKDDLGNDRPDRSRQVYAPVLARWLRDNEPALFASIFAGQDVGTDATLTSAAYTLMPTLYTAFSSLSLQRQRRFLINDLYFNELAQASIPTSPSYQQFIRGYRAIEKLFPHALGYTDNLAAYDTDTTTINADHPLGVPRRKLVNGQPLVADRVHTGDADLRLATFQTARGGDITVLAPGGDFIVGSVVRTSQQSSRRDTRFYAGLVAVNGGFLDVQTIESGNRTLASSAINAIPLGYEGLLTLRGGSVRSFTDGDLRLNQSRLFTLSGGDITAWSSNGDLNAGQGPKSAANFPPVTVRFDLNGNAQVDTVGGVAGGGIGAFKQKPTDPASTIILVAPVGEVDAGDAGVRASGNIFVAAARVANADNFAAGGSVSGVPSGAPVASAAPPSAAAAATAFVARAGQQEPTADKRTSITVDVVGFAGGDKCSDPQNTDPECPK